MVLVLAGMMGTEEGGPCSELEIERVKRQEMAGPTGQAQAGCIRHQAAGTGDHCR